MLCCLAGWGCYPSFPALPLTNTSHHMYASTHSMTSPPQGRPFTPASLDAAFEAVAAGTTSLSAAVGPAVGCLMTTLGTALISECIFDFEDPEELAGCGRNQRLELWGLQVTGGGGKGVGGEGGAEQEGHAGGRGRGGRTQEGGQGSKPGLRAKGPDVLYVWTCVGMWKERT